MPSLTKVQTGFLEPQGPFTLDPGTASAPGLKFSTSAATGMFSPSAGVLGFSTGSTQNALSILENGNVGIGLDNPGVRFESATFGSGDAVVARFRRNNNSDQHVFDISVNPDTDTVKLISTGSANGSITLGTLAVDTLTTTNSGNVGIGTTNPTQKLHVVGLTILGDVLNNTVTISNNGTYDSGSGAGTILNIVYGGSAIARISNTGTGVRDGWFSLFNEGTVTVNIAADASRGGNTYFNNGGNVGIGITSPQKKLHIHAPGNDLSVIRLTGSAANQTEYDIRQGIVGVANSGFSIYDIPAEATRLCISSVGNVGIGTNSPLTKFFVKEGSSSMGFAEYNGGATIWLDGADGDISGGDYFNISANNSQQLAFGYAGGTNVTMSSTGNFGIGINPSYKLDVNGSIRAYSSSVGTPPYVFLSYDVTPADGAAHGRIAVSKSNQNSYSGKIHLQPQYWTGSTYDYLTNALVVDATGNVGIGIADPSEKLHVHGDIRISNNAQLRLNSFGRIGCEGQQIGAMTFSGLYGANITYLAKYESGWKTTGGGTASAITIDEGRFTFANSQSTGSPDTAITWTDRLSISNVGNVGIGATNPLKKLDVRGDILVKNLPNVTNASAIIIGSAIAEGTFTDLGVSIRTITENAGSNAYGMQFFTQASYLTGQTEKMRIAGSGAVTVYGSLSKGSGSFKIDHPLPEKTETHHLVHSFVESPQANNIYRGKVTLENGQASVNLDEVSGMTEGTFVLLNRDIHCFTSNETDWDNVKGSVDENILTITCQNQNSNATVSWLVLGERQDQHMYDTDWTDDNGRVIVEPLKNI